MNSHEEWFRLPRLLAAIVGACLLLQVRAVQSDSVVPVAGQPLAANVARFVAALDLLGASLPAEVKQSLADAVGKSDSKRLQQVLDDHVLFIVELNPESRIKVRRGSAKAVLQQGGYTPVGVKIVNLS